MPKISILTNNSCPNSKAFNCPLLVSRQYFKDNGCDLDFYWKLSERAFNCDVLFINSNIFRPFWKIDKIKIFKFLESANARKLKVFWFDTTDSTWCTQFEVMPYIDKFLKNHVLKDRSLYLKTFRTGRIFTDVFDQLYNSGEAPENYPATEEKYLSKMGLAWAPCFERYDENRYSVVRKMQNLTFPLLSRLHTHKFNVKFADPGKPRPLNISARFGLSHSRPSVVAHRKAVANILNKYGVDCSRIPMSKYFAEMRSSMISVSPFGVGEFCYRDYESIVCGAVLLKPDMSHLETWPDLYQPDVTYVPFKWDLSDLEEKIDALLSEPERCREIATNAQKIYRHHLSEEGIAEFAERLVSIIQ